jgi:hypothetical protein
VPTTLECPSPLHFKARRGRTLAAGFRYIEKESLSITVRIFE